MSSSKQLYYGQAALAHLVNMGVLQNSTNYTILQAIRNDDTCIKNGRLTTLIH